MSVPARGGFLFWLGLAVPLPGERTGQPLPVQCPLHRQGSGGQGPEKWLKVDQKVMGLNTSHIEAAVGW